MLNIYTPFICSFILLFCANPEVKKEKKTIRAFTYQTKKHPEFNSYWYNGKAEITSYKLYQHRYGEIHTGTAVTIFVTEDFLPDKQVKADYQNDKNIPILKLNSTKKFVTGMYPYSLMTSTFSPIDTNKKAIKISFSAQEWCGNTFIQLNNKANFNIDFYSYFQSNFDRKISLKKNILENELWNIARIQPKKLPIGELEIIPSLEFLALQHQQIKSYKAIVSLVEKNDFYLYTLKYPTLKRSITIQISKQFPFIIEGWEEIITKGAQKQITKASKIKTIQSAYWNKNGVADVKERKELGL